jgi:hypothetical protein
MSYKKKELAIFHPCVQPRFCGGFCIAHFISVLFFVLFVFVVWSEPCRWCLVSMLASSAVDSGFEPLNRIGGAMVSMLASSAVDSGFDPRSDQPNTRNCFSTKHAALRRKSKDYLDQNPDNVSEWSDISTCGVLFQ